MRTSPFSWLEQPRGKLGPCKLPSSCAIIARMLGVRDGRVTFIFWIRSRRSDRHRGHAIEWRRSAQGSEELGRPETVAALFPAANVESVRTAGRGAGPAADRDPVHSCVPLGFRPALDHSSYAVMGSQLACSIHRGIPRRYG